jgi:hypothetical protein
VSTPWFQNHALHNGQAISFSTTGTLPTGIVAGQIYYIQYGTVTPTTFQISATSIFGGVESTVAKGTAIATSGSQSGTHRYTTYGESWTDFILDPGVYSASSNQAPGVGAGLQKWRLLGYGARMQTNTYFWGGQLFDVNANTAGTTFLFQAQFQSSSEVHTSGNFPDYVVLNTAGLAVNFYVNSWVVLTCLEQQASANGNWNPAIFEYAKIKSVDAGTGIITFWDRLQYNYRSTYPKFAALAIGWTGSICGQASIVQLNDNFDQEIEVHGLNMYGVTEQTVGGVYSLRFVDCDMWGFAFDSGPSPVMVRKYTVERCRFHNCIPEIDKMIDEVNYIDCDFDRTSYPRFQSASINKAIFDRCKMMGGFSGTPKDLTIRDSFMAGTFTIGPVYGSTQRMTLVNSHIQRMINNDQATETLSLGTSGLTFVNSTIKIASGTTTIYGLWAGPSSPSICPAPWAAPGAKIAIDISPNVTNSGSLNCQGTCGMMTAFTVLDVYTDGGGAFCIDTDMAALPSTGITVTGTVSGTTLSVTAISPAGAVLLKGAKITGGGITAGTIITSDLGLPNTFSNLGNYGLNVSSTIGTPQAFTATLDMNFLPHSCPRLTVLNCTGSRWMADMAGAPADIPMYSYFKRAYAGGVLSVVTQEKALWLAGNLLSWTINVLKPYTGADATYLCVFYVFGFAVSGGITYPTYITQTVDLKTTGLRTITAAGVSGSVGADSIAAIPFWVTGSHLVTIGHPPSFVQNGADNLSNFPFFVMQAQTDQGIGFASMVANTVTAGVDEFADTIMGAAQQS